MSVEPEEQSLLTPTEGWDTLEGVRMFSQALHAFQRQRGHGASVALGAVGTTDLEIHVGFPDNVTDHDTAFALLTHHLKDVERLRTLQLLIKTLPEYGVSEKRLEPLYAEGQAIVERLMGSVASPNHAKPN